MGDHETQVSAALDNLAQIKQGNDPRDGTALSVARAEVDRLWSEHDLDEYLDRDRCHVATARWKRKNGCCMYNRALVRDRYGERVSKQGASVREGHASVVINGRIHDEGRDREFIDTVRHEVAHAIAWIDPACGPRGRSPGHGRSWKRWARRLGAEPSSCGNKRDPDYEYMYGCPNGCWESGRFRRSKKIKHPGRYSCKQCGESCVSWLAGEDRPAPGTTGVIGR